MEREAGSKNEYHAGRIYALAGASESHAVIASNLVVSLGVQLRDKPCRVYAPDMRVKVTVFGLYTYPDVVVVCGQGRFEDTRRDTLLNPTVIVEVLSPSTEGYERGRKFEFYRGLESLTDYVIIAQDRPLIEHYLRLPDQTWLLSDTHDLSDVAHVETIGCDLPLSDIYAKVEFPPEDETEGAGGIYRVKEEPVAHAPGPGQRYHR
jgi:Uma2 family endonuclease